MIPQYEPWIDRISLAQEVSNYTLGDNYFTEYKNTQAFEKKIATLLGVKYCFALNNGTISLSLALLANGIKPGDNVLVPNITMIGTSSAVKLIGANPIFVDIDPTNLCMDLKKALREIEYDYIKAVIYVTLNGRSHDIDELKKFHKLCKHYNIAVIEDNAQSLGSNYSDCIPISCPIDGIGSFSFSMPKIIMTGQGGCLVTNNDKLALKIKKLKDFGRTEGGIDIHDDFGINCKFTEYQAIMGLNQLKNINSRILIKQLLYRTYRKNLGGISEIKMLEGKYKVGQSWTPWFVDIYIEDREKLQQYLKDNGIGTRVMYPELTSQVVNKRGFLQPKTLKVSGKCAKEGLWLPSSMTLKEKDIVYICNKIKEFYGK